MFFTNELLKTEGVEVGSTAIAHRITFSEKETMNAELNFGAALKRQIRLSWLFHWKPVARIPSMALSNYLESLHNL
jgi:hypothetical protein